MGLELRDVSGETVLAETWAAPQRLTGRDLAPEALERRLASDSGARRRPARGMDGFTLLVPDAPEEARRFRVHLTRR